MLSERYNEDEVRRLLHRGEGQLLEFKSLLDRTSGRVRSIERRRLRDLVAEYTAAFANADGGTIVLGVEDDGTATGHRLPDEVIDGLAAVAIERLRPPVSVEVTRLMLDGHEVVLVDVAMSTEAVMATGNGFPYRVGDTVIREPQEVINDRKQSYRRVGFEHRLPPDASLNDLDARLVDARFGDGARSLEDKLLRRGLVQPGRRLAVTNAALLLFASAPVVRWHPRAGVRVFRVEGSERRHGRDRKCATGGADRHALGVDRSRSDRGGAEPCPP
jgi:ATP-dependent DNA helicase RecG